MTEPAPLELARLLARLPGGTRVEGNVDRTVAAIETDSRAVRPGALFVALQGERADGRVFAAQAIERGAVAIVAEAGPLDVPRETTVIRVGDVRRALSEISAAFYGDPSRALDVVGITGTNGKTTTAHLVAAIANEAGRRCGTIGTVGAEFEARRWGLAHTTPLPPELHGLLAAMRDAGASTVAMEVSSHALALERVADIAFRVAVLTNVTRDHLDFHVTLDGYAAAKRKLFALAETAVLNVDDAFGARWARELRAAGTPVMTYGESAGDLRLSQVVASATGTRFELDGMAYELPLPGRFNALNALAAIAVARSLGIDDAHSARALGAIERIPGRMERVSENGIDAFVDYAHTPDALERALRALREVAAGSVTVVFGCGGDRDRGKRPEMGAIAARFADSVFVTSDNPRSEDPRAIADEIVAGIAGDHIVELDRAAAIERAIAQARPGDAVLIAGKGHETYQIVGERRLPFDDVATARHALHLHGTAP